MKATCEVVHSTTGRIRLQVQDLGTNPKLAGYLNALLIEQPGVTHVQFFVANPGIVVKYDPLRCSKESILRALRPRELAAPDKPQLSTALVPTTHHPYRDCAILHQVPGRVRLGHLLFKTSSPYANALASFVDRQADITGVRLSRTTGSIIVNCDPDFWDAERLLALVQAYDPTPAELERWQSSEWEPAPDNESRLKRHMHEVAMAAAALLISLVAPPAATPLVIALLAVSGQTVGQRWRKAVFYERRLTVDVLDAAAFTILSSRRMFWQLALLNLMISAADWIRTRTHERARQELDEVLDFMTDEAWVSQGDELVAIPIQEVKAGDTIYVFRGERVPVDGIVIGGKALVDEHALTGESMPVEKAEQDQVFATTVVSDGEIRVRATRIGNDTQVGRVVQLVRDAPVFDTRAQDYCEKWANRMVPYSLLGAGMLALTGNITAAATLLMIDYSAGFRVAAPTAVMSTMGRAARQGIFIRGGRHVELLAEIDAIVFDKTGTLTRGSPEIVSFVCISTEHDANTILSLAAGAMQYSSHPVARAILNAACERGLRIPKREEYGYQFGRGVAVKVEGQTVTLGTQEFLASRGISFSAEALTKLSAIEAEPASPLCIALGTRLVGLVGLADSVRPEAAQVIADLGMRGIREIMMVTGDRQAIARSVAQRVGIDHVISEAFPTDKLAIVKQLQSAGMKVAVVGDGINDSPALAQADVGIAVNGGTALSQESADVVILQGNLEKLVEAIDIARQGAALIKQNWDIIRVPNTIGLGLAFAGAIGPLGASLISDGAALAAGANSLRPLIHEKLPRPQTPQIIRDDRQREMALPGDA